MDAQEVPVDTDTQDAGAQTAPALTGEPADVTGDGLAARLAVIESQPLEERATAYMQVHDELRDRLEGGDVSAVAHR